MLNNHTVAICYLLFYHNWLNFQKHPSKIIDFSDFQKEYLASNGIDEGRLNLVSYGKERPDAEGSFDDAWSKNRRSVTTLDVDR